MIVKDLVLKNYRMFRDAHFSFVPGMNLIVGPNGSGKTTILEAISYAVYGEPIRTSNLASLLRYGSDLCRVALSLANSETVQVAREVKKSNNTATQTITLNDEVVTYADINKMRRVFPDKELFYELIFIDPMRHDILDMNKSIFRDIFSRYLSHWDIARVLDSSKSLQFYIKSKEKIYSEKIEETRSLLSRSKFKVDDLEDILTMRTKTQKELEHVRSKISGIEDKLSATNAYRKKALELVEALEQNLDHIKRFSKKIALQSEFFRQTSSEAWQDTKLANYLNDYFQKINTICAETRDLSESLQHLVAYGKDYKNQILENESKLTEELQQERQRIRDITMRLNSVSEKAMEYEKEKGILQQTMDSIHRYENDLEQCVTLERIEQKLEDFVRKFWAKQSVAFFSKVKDHANLYLKEIGVDINVVLEEDRIEVLIKNERLSLGVLSGGERTLLNLLVRTALIKGLNENSILILDHPTALLDKDKTLKFFSFLNYLKKDFRQVIMTTPIEGLPIETDKRIALTGEDTWHENEN